MTVCDVDPTITIDLAWSGGSLSIPPDCDDSGYWWNSLAFPAFDMRYTTAPPSSWIGGDVLLGAVAAASTLPVSLAVHETSVAALEAAKATVAAAFRQLGLTITLNADGGQLAAYEAFPAVVQWGEITPQMYGLFAAEGSVVVPVNPEDA